MNTEQQVRLLARIYKAAFVFAESIDEGMVEAYDANMLKRLNKVLDDGVHEFGDPTIVKPKA